MKQIILLISLISSIFTYTSSDNQANLKDSINGGWTLIGVGSKVLYYDADNQLIAERLLPLKVSGTIINVSENDLIIRNNKNQLINVGYTLDEKSKSEGDISIKNCSEVDNDEIASLIDNKNFELKRDNNKTLYLTGNFAPSSDSKLLDKSIDFDHATVNMIFKKNSFFSDILPY